MTQVERCKPIVDILIKQLAQTKPEWSVKVNYVFVSAVRAFELLIDSSINGRRFSYVCTTLQLSHLEKFLEQNDGPDTHARLAQSLISMAEHYLSLQYNFSTSQQTG